VSPGRGHSKWRETRNDPPVKSVSHHHDTLPTKPQSRLDPAAAMLKGASARRGSYFGSFAPAGQAGPTARIGGPHAARLTCLGDPCLTHDHGGEEERLRRSARPDSARPGGGPRKHSIVWGNANLTRHLSGDRAAAHWATNLRRSSSTPPPSQRHRSKSPDGHRPVLRSSPRLAPAAAAAASSSGRRRRRRLAAPQQHRMRSPERPLRACRSAATH